MGAFFPFTSRVCATGGDGRSLIALLVLGLACQLSLDLDQYSIQKETVGVYEGQPSGGMSGAIPIAGAGGSSGNALGGSPSGTSGSGGSGSGGSGSDGSGSGGSGVANSGGMGGTVVTMDVGSAGASSKLCPDEELLLDDMEDDPAWICPHYGRNQNPWFTFVGSSDEALSATVSPTPFSYEAIPAGRMASTRAIHVVMSSLDANDFAGLGVNFSFSTVSLPFDASRYGGLSLYARGSGTLRVRLTTPETTPVVGGGRCVESVDEPCYNDHYVVLELTDIWQLYQYPFADFMPADYGPLRGFDTAELFGLSIAPAPGQSDVDIWIDDIWFLPGALSE